MGGLRSGDRCTDTFSHQQTGWFHYLGYALAVVAIWAGVQEVPEPDAAVVMWSIAAILLLMTLSFAHLTVQDEGDALAIRYGPLSLFRKCIPYASGGAPVSARTQDQQCFPTLAVTMPVLKRIVLDVLKPHQPNALEFAQLIAVADRSATVTVQVIEVDEKTESTRIECTGGALDYRAIESVISEMGGSVHSIDEVVVQGDGSV